MGLSKDGGGIKIFVWCLAVPACFYIPTKNFEMSTNSNNANTPGAITIVTRGARAAQQQPKKKKKKSKPAGKKNQQVVVYNNNPRPKQYRTNSLIRSYLQGGDGGRGTNCCGITIPPKWRYLANLLAPREAEGGRIPDMFCREKTATYQTKWTININGSSGALVGANDIGRFAFVVSPTIFNDPTFDATSVGFQLAVKDGPGTAWTAPFDNNTDSRTTYSQDPMIASLCPASMVGTMMRTRPVSMSVLCTYNGQILNGGGNISIHCLPGESWQMFGTSATSTSPCGNWENLARQKGAFDGPLSEGAYCIWLPDDERDYLMASPYKASPQGARTKESQYPIIFCSGQVTPVGAIAALPSGPQLRVDIYINHEYTTENRLIETEHGSKNEFERGAALRALAYESISMANGDHIDWIKTILGGILGFAARGIPGAILGASVGAGLGLGSQLKYAKSIGG